MVSTSLSKIGKFIERTAQKKLVSGITNAEQGIWEYQNTLYAYSKVVEKRLFDVIPLLVRKALVLDISKELGASAVARFDDHTIEKAMNQDPKLAQQRRDMEKRLKQLEVAHADFNKIQFDTEEEMIE